MSEDKIYQLAEIAQEAQAKIQQDFSNIDPIIGILKSLRPSGIPADALTIDCLNTGKRIALILHDSNPDIVAYQFGYSDKDESSDMEQIPLQSVTALQIYEWIKVYFSEQM